MGETKPEKTIPEMLAEWEAIRRIQESLSKQSRDLSSTIVAAIQEGGPIIVGRKLYQVRHGDYIDVTDLNPQSLVTRADR